LEESHRFSAPFEVTSLQFVGDTLWVAGPQAKLTAFETTSWKESCQPFSPQVASLLTIHSQQSKERVVPLEYRRRFHNDDWEGENVVERINNKKQKLNSEKKKGNLISS
jgi:hypothetical protein